MLPASKHRGNLSVWLSLTIKEFSPIINLPNQCLIFNLKKKQKQKKTLLIVRLSNFEIQI